MTEPIEDRSLTIVRVMDVPARYIFKAMAAPDYVKKWFGPGDYPLTHCEMDFRVGGKFRFAMTGPDGKQSPFFGGTYREIIDNMKIVYDNTMELPGGQSKIITVTLTEIDGKTTVTLHTEFATVAMKDREMAMGYEIGTGMGLDQLAELAKSLM